MKHVPTLAQRCLNQSSTAQALTSLSLFCFPSVFHSHSGVARKAFRDIEQLLTKERGCEGGGVFDVSICHLKDVYEDAFRLQLQFSLKMSEP